MCVVVVCYLKIAVLSEVVSEITEIHSARQRGNVVHYSADLKVLDTAVEVGEVEGVELVGSVLSPHRENYFPSWVLGVPGRDVVNFVVQDDPTVASLIMF